MLLAAFRWILLVVWPARLPCEWASLVGGEQGRAGGGEERGGEGPSTLSAADFNLLSVSPALLKLNVG